MNKKLAGLLVLTLWLGNAALASYISLNTTLRSKAENNNLKVSVAVTNKGDESAFNVQAEFTVNGKNILASKMAELPVGGNYKVEENFKLSLAKPGTYPLTLVMHYTDANQYPFSALTGQTFAYKTEAVSPIFGQLKSTSFSKEGQLKLVLKNSGDAEIKTNTYLVAPRELTVAEKALSLAIAPKAEQSGSFAVKKFSALSGSTYQVFAISEFEDQGLHYTSISPGTIKIVERQEIFGLSYTTLFIILAMLIIIFIGAQFFKWNKS